MSRLGNKPIDLPKGVEIKVTKDNLVTVKGTKGTLSLDVKKGISIEVKDDKVMISLDKKTKLKSSFHGLYRSLISNMIEGTNVGFKKELKMIGVGFRSQVKGDKLDLQVGFSHPCEMEIPKDLQIKITKSVDIEITGIDKQKVGQFASEVRAVKPPEPYKGKGIRYKDEYVRKKAGKAAKTGK